MSRHKVKLNICGLEFVITTEDREEDVREAARSVEQSINNMLERNSRVSITLAAVITALSFYDDARRSVQSADNLRSQIKNYLEDASRARLEADEARREIERMKKEIRTLRTRLGTDGEIDISLEKEKMLPTLPPAEKPIPSYIKSSLTDVLPDQESFVSFFEKKED